MKNSCKYMIVFLMWCMASICGGAGQDRLTEYVVTPFLFRIKFISQTEMMNAIKNSQSALNQVIEQYYFGQEFGKTTIRLEGDLMLLLLNTRGPAESIAQGLLRDDESITKITIKKWPMVCKKK